MIFHVIAGVSTCTASEVTNTVFSTDTLRIPINAHLFAKLPRSFHRQVHFDAADDTSASTKPSPVRLAPRDCVRSPTLRFIARARGRPTHPSFGIRPRPAGHRSSSNTARRYVAIDVAATADENNPVPGWISCIPFDFIARNDDLFPDLAVRPLERTIRAIIGDNRDVLPIARLVFIGPIRVGLAAARENGLSGCISVRNHSCTAPGSAPHCPRSRASAAEDKRASVTVIQSMAFSRTALALN